MALTDSIIPMANRATNQAQSFLGLILLPNAAIFAFLKRLVRAIRLIAHEVM
jgi:hypothetical protein